MRSIFAAAAIAAITMLNAPAQAGGWFGIVDGLVGNDTGGIIPWSPVNEQYRYSIAGDYCAIFRKSAHITSVHRQYGDYIAFVCRFAPRAIITKY